MIGRNDGGFFAAHWDWLAAGVGILALAGGVALYLSAGGADPVETADAEASRLAAMRPKASGVKEADLAAYRQADALPHALADLGRKIGEAARETTNRVTFLSSDRRVYCAQGEDKQHVACERPIPFGLEVCPYCGTVQPVAKKIEVGVKDADGDGLPDDWEKANGLNPNDPDDANGDPDRDGFTNLEEYRAKTEIRNAASHPDYFDDLRIELPVKETVLPFYLRSAMKTPSGWKLEFFDLKRKNDYGTAGTRYSVFEGKPIGDTGFKAGTYEVKTAKRKIKGSANEKTVDVSSVTVERESDGKKIELVIDDRTKKAVDIQAKIVCDRGSHREFVVVPGKKFKLYGVEFLVRDVKSSGGGATATLESDGRTRTISSGRDLKRQ